MSKQEKYSALDKASMVGPEAVPVLTIQVERIMAEAKRQGATDCEVSVVADQGLSTTVRQCEVETVEFNQDRGFSITLYHGRRKASASTSDISDEAIQHTVAAALEIARHTSEDEFAGLAEPELMAAEVLDLDLYHPWMLTPQDAIDLALECEGAALDYDSRVSKGEGTTVSLYKACRVYGNSHGFVGGYAATRHSLSCEVIAEENGQMQRDYWYDVSRSNTLASPPEIGRCAAQRAVNRLGSRSVPTCEVPVLFAAEVASSLFGSFMAAIAGANLYRKNSFLEGMLGQQLLPDWVSIDEHPHVLQGLGSASFDNDGLPTRHKFFVEQGRLVSYLLSVYSGRKLGMPSTANSGGARNLMVAHCGDDRNALFRRMGRGVLVTELMGQGVNMVTGDYSRGASGFWVEHGEIQYPVRQITIAGNLRDMFERIEGIGNDYDLRGNIRTGSVLIDRMMVAGH